ncbi:MAG: hypothetical protein DWI12_05975 [Planctomycetota bacterium]|nr:MAG: hypothetical protein DWI12_05975 [Planctomycetota bacterium]
MIPVFSVGLVALSCSFSHAIALTLNAAPDVTVARRGGATDITAATVIADERGVEVKGAKTPEFIPWDEVRAFVGTPQLSGALVSSRTDSLAAQLALGEDLWRARIRVARGDYDFARPLLAKHWAQLRSLDGPTASLAAEAMLLCALHHENLGAAVVPWIEVLRHRAKGEPSRFATEASPIDAQTGLLSALSPFVPAARRVELLDACRSAQHRSQGNPTGADATALAVAALMERLIIAADGGALSAPAASSKSSAAPRETPPSTSRTTSRTTPNSAVNATIPTQSVLLLLDSIVSATDLLTRNKAVAEFDRVMPEPPTFLGAWRLAAIGTSSARAARATVGDARTQALERAAMELLAVPAAAIDRSGLVDEYALEMAEALLRESGDVASADQVASVRTSGANGKHSDRLRPSTATGSTTQSSAASSAASTAASTAHTSFVSSSAVVENCTTHRFVARRLMRIT